MSSNTVLKKHLCFILGLMFLMTGCATPLMQAVKKGDINGVKALLDQGADVNESFYGETALMNASYYGPIEIVKMLLDRGADVNTVRVGGWSALSSAASGRHTDIVKLLLERGADIDKAIWGLRENTITQAKDAVAVLKKFKQQRIARKPATVIPKPPQEVLPVIKSDVDVLPLVMAKLKKNAYAIVIGEYLTKVMGYPEENIVTLINDRALKSDMEKYFEKWLSNNLEKNGTVFVYYSGHGAPNPNTGDAYLVPYDGDPSFIEQTGYSLKRLYQNLNKLPAKEIIVVLDSCFSGAGGRSVLAKGARPLVMNMDKQVFHSDRIAILSAAAGNQISSTYDEKGHGLFTYFFLKGIKGAADTDKNGKIDMEELYWYVKPNVERIARKAYNNEQTPQLIVQNNQLSQQVIFIK